MINFLINLGFFVFGLIGVFGHILFKLRDQGITRFNKVFSYIRENQIPVALSVFMYFIVYLLWNGGLLGKWLPKFWFFQTKLTWITPMVAYLSDSIFRNFVKNIDSAITRRNGG